MENQEQQLKNEIRSLFNELVEEEKERFDFVTMSTRYPRNYFYVNKAKELYNKAIELEKVNSKYSTEHLKLIFNKEIYFVEHHEYKYKGRRIIKKSVDELQKYMHNATYHIKLYFYDVLGDIEID
ncbi:MAG: hypothetical protein K5899_00870 [Bacteroidaceae bacterium]|nr:hypothetical protein [Bacteroidaceae bacterium]